MTSMSLWEETTALSATGYLFSAAGLSFLLSLLATVHILRYKKREATSAVLWIFVVFTFPFLGPALYFLFGVNRVEVKGLHLEAARRQLLSSPGTHVARTFRRRAANQERFGLAGRSEPSMRLTMALDRQLPDMPALGGNHLAMLHNGDQAYPAMLQAIQEARSSIHLQTYIIRTDSISRRFLDLLRAKAREGVRVRLLYDRLGSSAAHLSGLFLQYRGIPNLKIAGYALIHPLKRRLQINLRNHRKLLVVDGRVGFLGGINIHDENLSTPGHGPSVQDYHFQIRGPAVSELQYSFLQDWFYTSREGPAELLQEDYFPAHEPQGEEVARVVRSGPGPDYEAIYRSLFTLVVMSQRSIKLLTPYFVPDAALFTALLNAAARGVDVKLVLPERNNHWYLHFAARNFYGPLLEAGVRIFEKPPPFVHAKATLVDNQWGLVGSANLDIRSFRLNFELNLETWGPFAEEVLREILDREIAASREVTLRSFEARRSWEPVLETFCALASPIL